MADSIIAQVIPTSASSIAGSILLLLLAYQASIYIYNIFFHPLRRFPGPILARASAFPKVLQMTRGDEIFWILKLHAQYGDVVRMSPDELSFAGSEAYKDIHGFTKAGRTTLEKDTKFYIADPRKAHSVINAPGELHGRHRKIFANAFSDRALKLQEPLFVTYIDKMMSILRATPGKKHEMVRLYNYQAFDIIADLTFGESFGMLDNQSYHPWVQSMLASFRYGVYHHALNYWPSIKSWLMGRLIPQSLKEKHKVQEEFAQAKVDKRLEQGPGRNDIMGLMLEKTGTNPLPKPEIYANAGLFMVAGTETTATALSGMTFNLLTHPDKLDRLVKEVRDAFEDESEISVERLQALPWLNAVIEEGLRCYPPVALGLPRKCPDDRTIVIDGWEVPPKTIVQVTNLAAFRNPKSWRDPEKFVPERWLPNEPEGAPYINDQRHCMLPFSYGPNACIGRNMAYHEMRLVLTKMFYNFDLKLCEESKDWINHKLMTMWEKPDLMCQVQPRQK